MGVKLSAQETNLQVAWRYKTLMEETLKQHVLLAPNTNCKYHFTPDIQYSIPNIFDMDKNLWTILVVVRMRLKMSNDSIEEDVLLTESYKYTQHSAKMLENKLLSQQASI